MVGAWFLATQGSALTAAAAGAPRGRSGPHEPGVRGRGRRSPPGSCGARRREAGARRLLAAAAGAAAVTAPIALWLLAAGALDDFFAQVLGHAQRSSSPGNLSGGAYDDSARRARGRALPAQRPRRRALGRRAGLLRDRVPGPRACGGGGGSGALDRRRVAAREVGLLRVPAPLLPGAAGDRGGHRPGGRRAVAARAGREDAPLAVARVDAGDLAVRHRTAVAGLGERPARDPFREQYPVASFLVRGDRAVGPDPASRATGSRSTGCPAAERRRASSTGSCIATPVDRGGATARPVRPSPAGDRADAAESRSTPNRRSCCGESPIASSTTCEARGSGCAHRLAPCRDPSP